MPVYTAYTHTIDRAVSLHRSEARLRGLVAEQGPSPRIHKASFRQHAKGRLWCYRHPVTQVIIVGPKKDVLSWAPEGTTSQQLKRADCRILKPKTGKTTIRIVSEIVIHHTYQDPSIPQRIAQEIHDTGVRLNVRDDNTITGFPNASYVADRLVKTTITKS